MSEMVASPGIYVIEVSHGVIKVGMSADTERRIATHLRNARGLGADPYRHAVVPCPTELLREAERDAQARTPEVFTGTYFTPVYNVVVAAVGAVRVHASALARLRGLGSDDRRELLAGCPDDVAIVMDRMLGRAAS